MKNTLLIFLGAIIFLSSCKKPETKIYEKYKGPMLVGYDIFTNYTDSGKVKMQMWAPIQHEMETGDRIFPKGITINFYENEKISSTLTSKHATFSKVTGIYTVRNNVEIKSSDQQKKLNTEELKWFPKEHKVRIEKDKFVRIQTSTEVLTGMGLDATEDFKWYKITKPQGVFAVTK